MQQTKCAPFPGSWSVPLKRERVTHAITPQGLRKGRTVTPPLITAVYLEGSGYFSCSIRSNIIWLRLDGEISASSSKS
eukprot:914774-Pelagomonas_calceolata.AAC.2